MTTPRAGTTAAAGVQRFEVRAWFGEYVVGRQQGPEPLALRFAAAMESQFPGLLVTVDPIPAGEQQASPIPTDARLWSTTICPGVRG